jgi:CRP/FNR family transcriptional regulator, cyclic AMP receptor protein
VVGKADFPARMCCHRLLRRVGVAVADGREPVTGSLLAYLNAEDRAFLLELGKRRRFAAGDMLLWQGDPTDHVLVIMAGWVRVYADTANGHEVLIALRGPGDVVGDQAALHGWTRTASVRTLEKVDAIQLRSEHLDHCLRARPSIAIALLRQMSERLREAETVRMEYVALDVTKRVAAYLIRLARQHGIPHHEGLALRMPLTQQDIANHLGASRRTVARALAVLRERRIVTTLRRRILILRPDVLDVFATSD